MSIDLGPNLTGSTNVTGTANSVTSTFPFDVANETIGNWDLSFQGRQPPPDNKVWEAEWSKFRAEFIRKLLATNPKGILNFKQQREKKGNRVYVKVEIEYSPDIDKGVRK